MIISDDQFRRAMIQPGAGLNALSQILAGLTPKFPALPSMKERREQMQARRQAHRPRLAPAPTPLQLLAMGLPPADLD